jgi:hypothetical protein
VLINQISDFLKSRLKSRGSVLTSLGKWFELLYLLCYGLVDLRGVGWGVAVGTGCVTGAGTICVG